MEGLPIEYLIDGYNLLHAWDRDLNGPDDLASARARLLDALADFSGRTGTRLTAVFDGTDLPYPDRHLHRGVRVRFSRTPQDADRLIDTELSASDHARDITVVSSDNAVRARAKAAGAAVMDVRPFSSLLREKAAPGRRQVEETLSDAEVRAWARTFGVDPDKRR